MAVTREVIVMNPHKSKIIKVIFAATMSVVLPACATGFVEDAARQSLASFIMSVFSTAVNDSINSSD